MRPPDFTKSVVVTGDWHFETPYVTLKGRPLAKLAVHSRFLDYLTDKGSPLLLVYAGDSFETRSVALERLAQERLEEENANEQPFDMENERQKLERELETTVQVVVDQLAERELLDISVFLPGNHDPMEGLYRLLGAYDVQILSYAQIPVLNTTVLIRHGAWSGMEQAATQTRKEYGEPTKTNRTEETKQDYGTAVLQRAKMVLMKKVTGLGFRVPPDWWVVLGHYASPVANPEYRVAGLSNWEGNLGGPFKRRIIQVDPRHSNSISVVKIPQDWVLS